MLIDSVTAYAQMCEHVKQCVKGASMAAIVGYTPELRYGDKNYASKPEGKCYFRVTVAETGEKARSLGIPARVTYGGVVGVQLFIPFSENNSAFKARDAATLVKDALVRGAGDVIFNKAGIRDMPPDGSWLYKRITAEFVYRQLV